MAEPNWKNRTLFEGDNLNFLRAMDSETVDLIATDPPFKKGRDFHATPDSLADGASFQDRWIWEDEVHDDWVDQLQDDHPAVWAVIDWSRLSYGDDMGAFLCFMAVRLLEMKRLLKPTGSIYLHCDPTASHYLKTLMDAIFGRHQFRNEIIRRRNESEAKGSQHKPKTWGTNTDSLLFYTKGKKATFDPRIIRDLTEEEIEKKFPHIDDFGERYKTKPSAHRQPSMGDRPNLYYEFRGVWPPYRTGWRLAPHRMEEEYQKGNIVVAGDKLERRTYARDHNGVSPGNLWTESDFVLGARAEERYGYPTQKPIALYERIVLASSNPGDMVLDPFCGCATTPIVAEKHGRQWAGIDIWKNARKAVVDRLIENELLLRPGDDAVDRIGGDLFAEGQLYHATEPPERTDGGEIAAPFLRVTHRRIPPPQEPWQKLSRATIMRELLEAQSITDGLVLCAGCGRELEAPFMELDHIVPRSDRGENDISNRILLCRPCNGRKSARLTMKGLMAENRKAKWMKDEKRAIHARDLAHERYEDVRYRRQWPAVAGDLFDQGDQT